MAKLISIVAELSSGMYVKISPERIVINPVGITYITKTLTPDDRAEAKELQLEYWPQS